MILNFGARGQRAWARARRRGAGHSERARRRGTSDHEVRPRVILPCPLPLLFRGGRSRRLQGQ
eukprot:7731569-Lingulodinium_polyedra.AAC.1